MKLDYKFPENFLWGAATSGMETEGIKDMPNKTTWQNWIETEPQRFHKRLDFFKGDGTYPNYKSNVQLMSDIKLNSLRTSIQWSRLISNFETGEVNQQAVEFYRGYFSEMVEQGVEPIITLFHFDMPNYIQETYGGFETSKGIELFLDYAKICFENFGDIVKRWIVFNEPIVPVEGGYLYDFHPPLKRDGKLAVQVAYNSILIQAKVIEAFKQLNDGTMQIGTVLNITPAYPRSNHSADLHAAKCVDAVFNKSFIDPAVKGHFDPFLIELLKASDVLPNYTQEELTIISENTVDFLGLNYYVPRRVKARDSQYNPDLGWHPDMYYQDYTIPGSRNNPHRDGNEIYPKALYDIAKIVQTEYGNISWYLSEIGIAIRSEKLVNNTVDDSFRTHLFKEHMIELHRAIEEGSNCFGVHQWTFIDCWSWINTYKRTYGFYKLDLQTQDKYLKKHGAWMKTCIENNGFKIEENFYKESIDE